MHPGNTAGYVFSVTSGDGYAGNITISVGISADGTVNGISFTELNETAGMGMLCADQGSRISLMAYRPISLH